VNVRSTSDELDTILARNAGVLETDINRTASALMRQDMDALRDATDRAAGTIGRILAYSDLLGRRRMELLAQNAHRARAERHEFAAAPANLLGALPAGGILPQVTFDEAVSDIAARMPVVARGWEAVQKVYDERHAFACARAMTMSVTRRVQEIMKDAIEGGQPHDFDAVMKIMEETNWSRGYASTVYTTNASTAYSAGVWARAADPDVMAVIPGFEFVSAHLPTSRPNHEACAGLIAPTDSHLWNRFSPPLGYQCLPGDVRVSGNVEGAVRSRYSGQVVELHTRDGARLRLTGNHPVLTRRGWIAARLVREGDEVFRHLPDVHALNRSDLLASSAPLEAVGAEHDDNVPPRIQDVFDALAAERHAGEPILANSLPLDLHGDAQFTEREVHVVRADGRLPGNLAADPFALRDDFALVLAESAGASGHRVRGTDAVLDRHDAALGGGPRLAAGTLDALPMVGAVLGPAPRKAIGFGQAPDRDTAPRKSKAENGPAHAEFLGKLLGGLSGDVAPDCVVKVRDFHWTGHVYDLQTSEGWMVAESIVISNCQCSLLEVTVFEAEKQGLVKDGRMLTVLPPSFGIAARPDPGFDSGQRPDRRALFGSFS